mmetsp:Transcript_40343/g.94827  ORF Transcript_40343/g.94827 Transcript_40343/m.94827 type:complete len:424 (-) Transcript_40343:867-2138(-)
MLTAKALHSRKAICKRLAIPSVSSDLLLEGLVKEFLHPRKFFSSARYQFVPNSARDAAWVCPVRRRLQRRPTQRGYICISRHENGPAPRLMTEDHLHLPRSHTLPVSVVARAMTEGSAEIVAVACNQIPLTQVIHHEIAKTHRPLAYVALSIEEAVPFPFAGFGWLQSELVALIDTIAMSRVRLRASAIHLFCDELVQLIIDSVGIEATNLNQAQALRGGIAHWYSPQLNHEKRSLCPLLSSCASEFQLLFSNDIVGLLVWISLHAAAIGQKQCPTMSTQEISKANGKSSQVVRKSITVIEPLWDSVLQVAKFCATFLPEVRSVLLAAPLRHQKVYEMWLQIICIMHTIDLDVAHCAQLHHDVIGPMLDEFVVAEHQLLLTFISFATVVAAIASDQSPLTLLHHEINKLHGAQAHVVLTFKSS